MRPACDGKAERIFAQRRKPLGSVRDAGFEENDRGFLTDFSLQGQIEARSRSGWRLSASSRKTGFTEGALQRSVHRLTAVLVRRTRMANFRLRDTERRTPHYGFKPLCMARRRKPS
eukprot:Pompholyxophrys_punicea_v1_NODE_2_length_10808_cov_35.677950.p11 type:complete len:116 gc:universal NODE_2_length_10808_cov_35.677950:2096-1749(-)